MAEYIEREALRAKAIYMHGFGKNKYVPLRAIEDAPAADVVEVVRCKDCKHCDPENHHCDHPVGTMIYFPRKPDDFCSYGERKGGEG